MTDIRRLRLALAEKLEHRRKLMTDSARLRGEVAGRTRERDTALAAMKSEVINFVLEDCADQIVNEILNRALDASRVVANETLETGDYEVGISVPSFHIRRRVFRGAVDSFRGEGISRPRAIKRVSVDLDRLNTQRREPS